MCDECWEEAGAPWVDTPAVREAAALVDAVYENSLVGGNLHVIVDDWNVEDAFFCADTNPDIEENIHEQTPEAQAVERACYAALKALTEDERYTALAMRDGYTPPTEAPDAE